MLRVLTKALTRHLERYSERGLCTLTEWGNEGDKEKLLHALTPQLEKHLLLKDDLFVEFSDSLKKETESTKNEEKKEFQNAKGGKTLKEVIKGLDTRKAKIDKQPKRIPESLLKRAELLEKRRNEANALLEILARREKLRRNKLETTLKPPRVEGTRKNEMVVKITKDSLELCPKTARKVFPGEKDPIRIQNEIKAKSSSLTDKIYDLGARIDKEIKAMLIAWVEKNDSEMKLIEIDELENEIRRNTSESLNKFMNDRKPKKKRGSLNANRQEKCRPWVEKREDNCGRAAQEKCAANATKISPAKVNIMNKKKANRTESSAKTQ